MRDPRGDDPHAGGRVAEAGPPLGRASCAVVLLHGRGGGPEDMLDLAGRLALPGVAWLAPEAAGRSWWPQSFLAPFESNEPGLSSALAVVAALRERAEAEVPAGRVAVMGFSQGGCLALEHAARAGRPMAAAIGLSAGLLGSAEGDGPPDPALHGHRPKRLDYGGALDGMPVLLSVHERDPHIPVARVRESEAAFRGLGAAPRTLLHRGGGHAVTVDDLRAVRSILNA